MGSQTAPWEREQSGRPLQWWPGRQRWRRSRSPICQSSSVRGRAAPRHVTPLHAISRHFTLLHSTPLHSTPLHSTPHHITSRHTTQLHTTPLPLPPLPLFLLLLPPLLLRLLLSRGSHLSPADASSLVNANHPPLLAFHALVDTELESSASVVSNAVSTSI